MIKTYGHYMIELVRFLFQARFLQIYNIHEKAKMAYLLWDVIYTKLHPSVNLMMIYRDIKDGAVLQVNLYLQY